MKKIAITQRIDISPTYYEVRSGLDIQWAKFFESSNILPIILPYKYSFETYFNTLDIEGIIFSGGNDFYHQTQSKISKIRDDYEYELLEFAISNKIPIIGICRGMQMIGKYFGVKLNSIQNHVATKHAIKFNENASCYSLINSQSKVNSYHNSTLAHLPKGFVEVAVSNDNCIEAIENPERRIYAQMWHPERNTIPEKQDINLIKHYLQ